MTNKGLKEVFEIYKKISELDVKTEDLQKLAFDISNMEEDAERPTITIRYLKNENTKEDNSKTYEGNLLYKLHPDFFADFERKKHSPLGIPIMGTQATKQQEYTTELTPEYILRICAAILEGLENEKYDLKKKMESIGKFVIK